MCIHYYHPAKPGSPRGVSGVTEELPGNEVRKDDPIIVLSFRPMNKQQRVRPGSRVKHRVRVTAYLLLQPHLLQRLPAPVGQSQVDASARHHFGSPDIWNQTPRVNWTFCDTLVICCVFFNPLLPMPCKGSVPQRDDVTMCIS